VVEELLQKLAMGQFDLSPVEELALRYIAEQRANALKRTQATLYRLFSTTSNGPLPLVVGGVPTSVDVRNHVVPERWVILLAAFGTAGRVTITQGGSDPVDIMAPVAGRAIRLVLPGIREYITLTNVTSPSAIIYTVAAVSGPDMDVL